MAQDVFSKMAEDPCLLREDGYLNADANIKQIVYHPTLNVILICTKFGTVHVLDVNSGFVLQSTGLSAQNKPNVTCRYISGQDRVLFCDGQSLGVRSDYNGILLLDTILQKSVDSTRDKVKLELLLSEAIIFKECLVGSSNGESVSSIVNQLTDKITEAQYRSKKGIKAQKWNTVCLKLPLDLLRIVTNTVITDLLKKKQHSPEISVASSVRERISELLGEPVQVTDRKSMASEARRRETFTQWPHMDYKWALPDQMAQSGFYHQPNSAGDDRAMCFTCSVCLVCWERTDEPWSEHERHSPTCPFIMGEYTQNVPLSVTYATNPAIDATYRGVTLDVLGTSSVSNLIATANLDGLVSVFDLSGKLRQTHSFYVTQYDSHLLEKYTLDFGVVGLWNDTQECKNLTERKITALTIVGDKNVNDAVSHPNNSQSVPIRPSIICGLFIKCSDTISTNTSNNQDKLIMEVDDSQDCTSKNSCLYLVVYDFQYTKELTLKDDQGDNNDMKCSDNISNKVAFPLLDQTTLSPLQQCKDFQAHANKVTKDLFHYQNWIPGESDEIYIPPPTRTTAQKQHSGPRVLAMEPTETDSSQSTSLIIPDLFYLQGIHSELNEKSISDHITELQNSKSNKKLNYSRAVQCISIPDAYKNRQDLIISDIIPSQDGHHVLIVVKSICDVKNSILILYKLDFTDKMVKLVEEPVLIRELNFNEKPIEMNIISLPDKNIENKSVDGLLIMVCVDGTVQMIELDTLSTVAIARLESEKFTSAVYCNSLERLCASTEKGSLHFYALNDNDNDSIEEQDDEELYTFNSDCAGMSSQTLTLPESSEMSRYFYDPPEILPFSELKRLHKLCNFEEFNGGFNLVVPPCWSEMQQAQRQRRNPLKDKEQITKTWRLQTDTTTWDEHIFEITLPAPTNIGHVYVSFTLHGSGTIPKVEFTLLKQNSSSIGHRKDMKFSVDETIAFDQLQGARNPVTSQEYLRAQNAEVLAGPVDISNCLDLSEQSGCVTLTSPKLFKTRCRNLLLHIKSLCSKDDARILNCARIRRSLNAITNEYMGCDCIHKLTISVYNSTHTDIPNEKSQRCLMLESNTFVSSLLLTATNSANKQEQHLALDILNWIACIRLMRNRTSCNGEAPSQQYEFINCIQSNLSSLLKSCLLLADRSIAHKFVKFIIICSDGAQILYDMSNDKFDAAVLTALLELINNIYEIKSAGALHWMAMLINKVAKSSELLKQLNAKCIEILGEISQQFMMTTNPYHLILRSRFGLYGTPLEPELFDIDPPILMKSTSSTVTYASIVSGENITHTADFHTNFAFNKENLDAKDVLLNVGETKPKLKHIMPSMMFRGLLETEPLHFVCVTASDGTRVERADANTGGVIHNVVPITVTHVASNGTKKVEVEPCFNNNCEENNCQETCSTIDKYFKVIINEDCIKLLGDGSEAEINTDDNIMGNKLTKSPSDEIITPNKPLPWQQLLIAPAPQVIVVERMHSGARRFVTIDFGQPVLLTDIFLPLCIELLSISIDIWLKGEDIDIQRLILATDISTKNLILCDLQPPPLCRYLKITAVGRYGMSSTRCRIPIGCFYGHLITLPEEIPPDYINSYIQPSITDLENQANVLSVLYEDVSCRYSLACSKLKNLLQPLLMSDSSNTEHLNAYMDIMKDKSNCTTYDNVKIFNAYQEAITYQRQLNTVLNVMNRIDRALNKTNPTSTVQTIQTVCRDKLRLISEVILEILLLIDNVPQMSLQTCEILFKGFCISQRSHLQFLTAMVLDHSCRKKSFWGIFLSDTLAEMFSSTYTGTFPQDKVFVLLSYLVKRCSERSVALDATLKVIAETLYPLITSRKPLLRITIDLPLLGWLLLFLSLQLDLSKNARVNSTRWDWVTGEFTGKTENTGNTTSYKNKLRKRFLLYKQQLDNIEYNQKSLQNQVLSTIATQSLRHDLEQALNGPDGFFSKLKTMRKKDSKCNDACASTGKSVGKRRRETPEINNEKGAPVLDPLFIDPRHSLTVVKSLLQLLLSIDHSCSADLFVLSCKVIARLVKMSNLDIHEYFNEATLLKLINLCIQSELPFATHALSCLLQDILDVGKIAPCECDIQAPSTSWTSDILRDVESLCESFEIEDAILPDACAKTSTPTNNNNVPFFLESDDSEVEDFLDGILERGRTILKKTTKSSVSNCGSSCAMDQRLDISVEGQAEVTLRRLLLYNSYTLIQNINTPANIEEKECKIPKWPDHLTSNLISLRINNNSTTMLTNCFDALFRDLEMQTPFKVEHVVQLWLTLNCTAETDKFNPSTIPFIPLNNDSINSLITTIAWSSDLSLRTWCAALQILTLMCNVSQGNRFENAETDDDIDMCRLFGKTGVILNHKDFVQMFVRLLSGTGIQFCEKGLAGPGLCKAMHDFIVRLEMRCDVTNINSAPGNKLKGFLLKVIYQLVQPTGCLNYKLGPLDCQCKFLQILSSSDYNNVDISIAMSIFESTGLLVLSYVTNVERIKCVNIGERLSPTTNTFSGIFASVLGNENNKQDKPVSWDVLLIYLLKLLASLVQTPLVNISLQDYMETEQQPSSQTDESKAEQQQQDSIRTTPPIPCLADTILQHHPSIIRLCKSLATHKVTSLSMISYTCLTNPSVIPANFKESGSVGDAVFNLLSCLSRKASRKVLIIEPLLMFLSQTPQLSEPLIWFIIQVLDSQDSLKIFLETGGIEILCKSLVISSNAPNTISALGNIALVMQHFVGQTSKIDASAIGVPSNTKKQQQANLENNLNLVNFAPHGTIRCSTSTSAHCPDILIQGGQAAHRRARAPQWSYHFYPEESHTDLTIQLPSAILLREVHIQPHQGSLATCPSAVSLEISADGPSRLVPACPPLPTSGISYIRLHLPAPEVINCVQIRLYKPRDASNIGLSQIRLLGTSAFGGNMKQEITDLFEDESHCRYSLGWLRLLYHCFTLSENSTLQKQIITNATTIPDLLSTCCGLLLVPTHIPALYLGNLEKVLCELSLYNRENSLQTILMLLDSRPNVTEPSVLFNFGSGKLLMNASGTQSACEILYTICGYQDDNTIHRIHLILNWLQSTAQHVITTQNTSFCSSAYISIIASIVWDTKESIVVSELSNVITLELFNSIYQLSLLVKDNVNALKCAIDSLLCSLCYVRTEFFPLLLQKMAVLIPNESTDHGASISDDRKDSKSMTDDRKQTFACSSEWYERLIIKDFQDIYLSDEALETIALVARSSTAIQQLIDSRLPQLLNSIILDYCNGCAIDAPMCTLKSVTAILKFFADISEEKLMRDWLGSEEGSKFWLPLLEYLCKTTNVQKSTLYSEEHTLLEEICVRFLSKCCLCHPKNQTLLAGVLCEVISQQSNGISGFLRRLILQLLLENEKIPISIKADETLYKNSTVLHPYLPLHPAFKQTHDRALLYLSTNTTIADILEQYISFSPTLKMEPSTSKKDNLNKIAYLKTLPFISDDSDLSVAAGVTAKDKRVKDFKNTVTSTPILKKKRYISSENNLGNDVIEGKVVKCLSLSDQPLSLSLTLAQILQLIEENGIYCDITCLHLTICNNKHNEDENSKIKVNFNQQTISSTLQVFSSMGGLALLAQHLPTVYPETIRTASHDKTVTNDQSESDWIKVDGSDDIIYEDIEEGPGSSTPIKVAGAMQSIPPHSLTAFGLFLRLPGYAEVLLRDMKKAFCLLRLVLGVTDDGEGANIFQGPIADSLPTLPFEVLRKLYDSTPLSTDDGTVLRRLSITTGVVHLLLACLGIFTHQTQSNHQKDSKVKDEKGQLYWAKGTGFGTGSTQQSWNVEQALLKQRSEEEHVTVLLQVLSSYINPGGKETEELSSRVLPPIFEELLANSALLPALSSYLRNDSVLDMARHIPLYKAALELLRAMAVSCQLVKLLLPQGNSKSPSISTLLKNMNTCVDTYASKLKSAHAQKTNKKSNSNKLSSAKYKYKVVELLEMERDEGLATLMPDIQETTLLVCEATDKLIDAESIHLRDSCMDAQISISPEEQYLKIMKKMQFDTYEMIQELLEGGYKFVISHHYESNARSAGEASHPARVKRLAQEAVTLATSLPLSHSSSVFVRCDMDRLDIMKVLITGPADTPYANGCFEFDVYFPPDYPLAPMMINLETTGHRSVRFNPNLYNDGKVCLSVLNTWHGRPEEKWNAQTSSFLQVLVSIQSLILVPEPYFNEPGYERSRGTPSGTQSSKEYNANVYQATVRWAMLEQLINPCPCFKDVIYTHFYIKRHEIMEQCERWMRDLENENSEKRSRTTNKKNVHSSIDAFKKIYETLKEMLLNLKPPKCIEEDAGNSTTMEVDDSKVDKTAVNGYHSDENDLVDIDMEKMVSDVCE